MGVSRGECTREAARVFLALDAAALRLYVSGERRLEKGPLLMHHVVVLGLVVSVVVALGSAGLALRAQATKRSMLGLLVEGRFAEFERRFGYDLTYARHIADTSPGGFVRFLFFSAFAAHKEDVPTDALFAVKIVAALHEDCGPCTQLVVTMAEREGVSPETLRAVLARDVDAMTHDASLGFRFAEASLARDLAAGDRVRDEVRARWGERALVSLAFAVASSRVYPGVKYALGYARTCSRVTVAGKDAPFERSPAT